MTHSEFPARYAPAKPFPPYAFVPGQHPHPVTDPKGHSFGQREEFLPAPDAANLDQNMDLRFALDLFNFGYYWEAHEVWEGLWMATGRRGQLADFFKALIHLAAAGVKAREGNEKGVTKHAERGKTLLQESGHTSLLEIAATLASDPRVDSTPSTAGRPVLGIWLDPEMLAAR